MKKPLKKLNPNARKWVDALRSGEFKQTRHFLEDSGGANCCLGVLCRVAIANGIELRTEPFGATVSFDGCDVALPDAVIKWAGLDSDDGSFFDSEGSKTCLAFVNDMDGKSFAEIADIIESQPEGLFV